MLVHVGPRGSGRSTWLAQWACSVPLGKRMVRVRGLHQARHMAQVLADMTGMSPGQAERRLIIPEGTMAPQGVEVGYDDFIDPQSAHHLSAITVEGIVSGLSIHEEDSMGATYRKIENWRWCRAKRSFFTTTHYDNDHANCRPEDHTPVYERTGAPAGGQAYRPFPRATT